MAYQPQFWDFVRNYDPNHANNYNGAGVDHAASDPFAFSRAGFPFNGSNLFDDHRGPWGGRGGHGHRGGHGPCRRGREGPAPPRDPESGEETAADAEKTDNEGQAREGEPSRGLRGHRHERDVHADRRGCHGHGRGRGGFGGRGGWGRRGHAPWMGGFDLSGLGEELAGHPIAQAFRSFAEGQPRSSEDADDQNTFTPPVDIFSTETAFVLHIALPGAKKEDVGVNWDAEKGMLNIAGVVYRQGDEEFLKTLSNGERKVGVFDRSIQLPPSGSGEEKEEVDSEGITAKMEDGVLTVTVPKVEKEWTEVKRVDIE